jgi:hypothetical protein
LGGVFDFLRKLKSIQLTLRKRHHTPADLDLTIGIHAEVQKAVSSAYSIQEDVLWMEQAFRIR